MLQQSFTVLALYLGPAALLMFAYWYRQRCKSVQSRRVYEESVAAGLLEPASLHPVIDSSRCLGCATCVAACPEKEVLGVSANRAQLITPASCIGHGACKSACPTGAINLVFGSATRGVDIPLVGADFQTNVEGVYIAGELGGMGLIRNAIEQGRQAVDFIAGNGRCGRAGQVDIVIVGAGPAGLSAAMAASEKGLSYKVLEQDSVGGTIAHYPRGKVVMTAPATLPLIGEFHFGETSKENLIDFWHQAVDRAGLEIATGSPVNRIEVNRDTLVVHTEQACEASNVLLAIGRRGTPRTLGVPGEDLGKVVYRLVDPEQYRGQQVLVVGGGDSALEAALSLAQESATQVLLSYRGSAFNRVKAKNRERVESASARGELRIEMASQVQRITPAEVHLDTAGGSVCVPNDAIIVCAGGVLPTGLLKSVGIEVTTHYGAAL